MSLWVGLEGESGAYPIEFGSCWEGLSEQTSSSIIVTDSNVIECYPQLRELGFEVVVIPAGERSKSTNQYLTLVDVVLDEGLRRNGQIIAVGGGVTGDLAGFVAASVHRGVDFVQVPTSLLAMVDSSVGGKVGIDLRQGKNLLGSFKNPVRVLIDLEFLRTLSTEHFVNGMAEVIKYGWIWDDRLLERLFGAVLTVDSEDLEIVIRRCVEIKRDVVEADFEEKSGVRAILNFGHTVGHGLEALDGYETLLHGEAIAIGMVAEAAIAKRIGFSSLDEAEVARGFELYGLPTKPAKPVDLDRLIAVMMGDKKNIGDELSMSLVREPGECKLVHGIGLDDVRVILAELWS